MSQMTFADLRKRLMKSNRRLLRQLDYQAQKIALLMEREAKINATSYPKVVTGRLRSSIHAKYHRRNTDIVLRAGGQNGGADVNYAAFVEYGTSGKDGSTRMAPRLYMGRAVDKVQGEIPKRLQNLLSIALKEV